MRSEKLFIGPKIKKIRAKTGLTQSAFAQTLNISASYLNLIENNQRHVTAPVLMALAAKHGVDITSLSNNETDRILSDLLEATLESQFEGSNITRRDLKQIALNTPDFAKAFLMLHQTNRTITNQITQIDNAVTRGTPQPTPYEEVRDFFHYRDNYIHDLDTAGEQLADELAGLEGSMLDKLSAYMQSAFGITVKIGGDDYPLNGLRLFNPKTKQMTLNPKSGPQTQAFQLAHQIGLILEDSRINAIASSANFQSEAAAQICKIGLANYFAGSIILPYQRFHQAAQDCRHDLALLSDKFGASLEQITHRLSTLQRPGLAGIPFFFARVDQAGNITKRHSATKLQFARFGSACPLWNVHSAFETPERIIKQLAETPDGEKYICIAKAISKRTGGHKDPIRRYALALGCEASYASQIVYCDDMNIQAHDQYDKIGVSCRICVRKNCHQRSLPPLNGILTIDPNTRHIVPFEFE